ncbi:MAG: hypothetical protein ACLQDV_15790 [Candidatus Binataceae bacterium]
MLAREPTLRGYHLLPATRGNFLRRLERWEEAAAEYRRALSLVSNDRERDFLQARRPECESHQVYPDGCRVLTSAAYGTHSFRAIQLNDTVVSCCSSVGISLTMCSRAAKSTAEPEILSGCSAAVRSGAVVVDTIVRSGAGVN